MPIPFGGLGVALVTLFAPNGDVDSGATASHAGVLVSLGVRFVLMSGSTGEAAALTEAEREQLIGAVRAGLPPSVPVIAGTGSSSIAGAVTLTTQACDAGADAILALSPPESVDLVDYYAAVSKTASGRPVLAYHFPTLSPPGIPLDLLADLPVAALKDSSRDPERIRFEISCWSGAVFVGSTTTLPRARSLGAAGAILGIANAEPESCVAAWEGDANAQRLLIAASSEPDRQLPQDIRTRTAERFGVNAAMRRSTRTTSGATEVVRGRHGA